MRSLLRRKVRLPAKAQPPQAGGLFSAPGEVPAVYSFTRRFTFGQALEGEAFQTPLTRCLEGVLAWAGASRHLVGQIKVFVENGAGESLWLASTGREPIARPSVGWAVAMAEGYQVSLTAIVFGPEQKALMEVTEALLARELESLARP